MYRARALFAILVVTTAAGLLLLVTVGGPVTDRRQGVDAQGGYRGYTESGRDGSAAARGDSRPKCRTEDQSSVALATCRPCSCGGDEAGEEDNSEDEEDEEEKEGGSETTTASTTPASQPEPSSTTPRGISILMLASMRTGSSFVGEIFDKHQDIFYMFEPGIPLQDELERRGAVFLEPLFIDVLASLFRCNATGHQFYLNWLAGQNRNGVKKKAPQMFDSCPKFKNPKGEFCGLLRPEAYRQECLARKHTVVKAIRVWELSSLLPLIQASDLRLKVLHLVRDPRGMITSRMLALHPSARKNKTLVMDDEMTEYLMDFCRTSVTSKEAGQYLPAFAGSYTLLRYEDMSLDPIGTARWVYNRTGLGVLPGTIETWLAKNTVTYKRGVYSTSRLSRETYQSWRTVLDLHTVRTIERTGRCASMMEHFGYLPIRDKAHLKNLSQPIVTSLPPPTDPEIYIV